MSEIPGKDPEKIHFFAEKEKNIKPIFSGAARSDLIAKNIGFMRLIVADLATENNAVSRKFLRRNYGVRP